jgi:toxin CcdB
MAKYDVYPFPDRTGYLLDVQAELLDYLNTRVVVPLLPISEAPKPAKRLNPLFDIGGSQVVMVTQFLAPAPVAILRNPTTNLSNHFAEITNALDLVFQGF